MQPYHLVPIEVTEPRMLLDLCATARTAEAALNLSLEKTVEEILGLLAQVRREPQRRMQDL